MSRGVCHSSRSIADQDDTPPDLAVARLAAKQHGVVSIHELRTCGLDGDGVALRVRRGRLHRLHRGVYAVGHAGASLHARFMAAVKACGPGAALSHCSAAAYEDFMRWERWRLPEVTVTGCARRVSGVRVHRSRTLSAIDVRQIGAIAVTSPARTLLDLAAILPEPALRRIARRAQAQRLVTTHQLLEIAERCSGHHGSGRLRALFADGPAPTRSELEDLLLDLLDGAGLPRPEINAPLRLAGRAIVPDYLWSDRRLAIEADGAAWHDHRLTRENDADKQAILEAHGYRVLRITWKQVTAQPRQTIARIRVARDGG